jgi:hypothetical protein
MVRLKKIPYRSLLFFLLGSILGAFAMRGYVLYEMHQILDGGPTGSGVRRMIVSEITSELSLTDEQVILVEEEVRKVQKILRSFEKVMHPKLNEQVQLSLKNLTPVLSTTQLKLLRAMYAELEKKRQKRYLQD